MYIISVWFIVVVLLTLVWLGYNRDQERKWTNYIVLWIFSIYITGVVYNTLLNRDISSNMKYELQFFWSYEKIYEEQSYYFWREIVLNIVLFVPFGIIVPFLLHQSKGTIVILGGLLLSIFIEIVQLLGKLGLFEFDDIFNNTLGAIIGYGVYRAIMSVINRGERWGIRMVVWLLPSVIVCLYFCILWVKLV